MLCPILTLSVQCRFIESRTYWMYYSPVTMGDAWDAGYAIFRAVLCEGRDTLKIMSPKKPSSWKVLLHNSDWLQMSAMKLWEHGEVSLPLTQLNLVVEPSLCNIVFPVHCRWWQRKQYVSKIVNIVFIHLQKYSTLGKIVNFILGNFILGFKKTVKLYLTHYYLNVFDHIFFPFSTSHSNMQNSCLIEHI